MPAIQECHNYVRITGPMHLMELLMAAHLDPTKVFPPTATDLLDQASWARTTFGTEWVVNEDNNGPPVVYGISNGGLGITSRFVSHEDAPIAFYKKLLSTYPEISIYYEFNAHHKRSVGYGEVSSKSSYSSKHYYTTEKQLHDIARSYHWRLPIEF